MPRQEANQSTIAFEGGLDTQDLLQWGEKNVRSFPWRYSTNAFHVLCAEFMLRRTRAEQVVPVYIEFTKRYESATAVLEDQESEVEALLGHLGLHWRIRQFRSLCQALVDRHGGHVPTGYDELLDLPGVGPYVAAAVRVFAFAQREPLIDTNVLRVFSRYFGVPLPDSRRRAKATLEAVARLMPRTDLPSFWWSILDLAAQVCTPKSPSHDRCPLKATCKKFDN